jgi:hypothetical protein
MIDRLSAYKAAVCRRSTKYAQFSASLDRLVYSIRVRGEIPREFASVSNSGSRSCQTFNVSTTIEPFPDLHASMNDWVRLIESEDSPLGDD